MWRRLFQRHVQKNDDQKRATAEEAAEKCSVSLGLLKKQVEEEVEGELKRLTDGVAQTAPKIESMAEEVKQIGKVNQLTGAFLRDCCAFADELGELNEKTVDDVCRIAEDVERRLNEL